MSSALHVAGTHASCAKWSLRMRDSGSPLHPYSPLWKDYRVLEFTSYTSETSDCMHFKNAVFY